MRNSFAVRCVSANNRKRERHDNNFSYLYSICSMICVPAETIYAKAAKMPMAYLQDCRAASVVRNADQFWCFAPSDFFRIRKKYRRYSVSEADTFREGEIISGCCDRADQY